MSTVNPYILNIKVIGMLRGQLITSKQGWAYQDQDVEIQT